jgi:hypothetical protein
MRDRFYAENSEYPRVIDTRDGKAVFTAGADAYDTAKRVSGAMNRVWERDVAFVAEWLETNGDTGDAFDLVRLWLGEVA